MQVKNIEPPALAISDFCHRWQICDFSLFGSVLRDDFHDHSDIDVLVVFEPDAHPTLVDLVQMKAELQQVFGREVDILTRDVVEQNENYIRRHRILNAAKVLYNSGCCTPIAPTEIAESLSPTERDESLLLDILIACRRIQRYTAGVSWDEFQKDCTLLQDATVYQLEIIGEAVKRLSLATRHASPEIPWSLIVDVCDCLTCDDHQVDASMIWDVVQRGVPKLMAQIEPLIPSEEQVGHCGSEASSLVPR